MRVMRKMIEDEMERQPEMGVDGGTYSERKMKRRERREEKKERKRRWKRKEDNRMPGHGTGQGRKERGMISR